MQRLFGLALVLWLCATTGVALAQQSQPAAKPSQERADACRLGIQARRRCHTSGSDVLQRRRRVLRRAVPAEESFGRQQDAGRRARSGLGRHSLFDREVRRTLRGARTRRAGDRLPRLGIEQRLHDPRAAAQERRRRALHAHQGRRGREAHAPRTVEAGGRRAQRHLVPARRGRRRPGTHRRLGLEFRGRQFDRRCCARRARQSSIGASPGDCRQGRAGRCDAVARPDAGGRDQAITDRAGRANSRPAFRRAAKWTSRPASWSRSIGRSAT